MHCVFLTLLNNSFFTAYVRNESDNSVSNMTSYRLDKYVLIPGRGRCFFLHYHIQIDFATTRFLIQWILGALSLSVMWSGREPALPRS
jgi:hypothetical protein